MQLSFRVSTVLLVLVGGVQIAGCQSLIPLVAVPVSLSAKQSQIDLVAGDQSVTCDTINFVSNSSFTIGRGTFEIDPSALSFITIETTPTGKSLAAQAIENTIMFTAFIAPATAGDTAVDVGDMYGPYTIVLDNNFQPVSVSPSAITLTQETVDLLNAGSFSLCLQIDSSVSGAFAISTVTLNLGL